LPAKAAHDEPRVRVLVVVDALDVLAPCPGSGLRTSASVPWSSATNAGVLAEIGVDAPSVIALILRSRKMSLSPVPSMVSVSRPSSLAPELEHVDDVSRACRRFAAVRLDQVGIATAAAVEVQGIPYGNAAIRTIVGRLQRRHVVDDDQVIAAGQAVGVARTLVQPTISSGRTMIVSPCRSPAISLYAEVSVPSIWMRVGSGSALWPSRRCRRGS